MNDGQTSRTLLISALIYSVVGGYLDAYTYLAQGGVFANAQTGNIIFFAVNLARGDVSQALRHLPPIAAYCAGYATIVFLRSKVLSRAAQLRNAGGLAELVSLSVLTLIGHLLPSTIVVAAIASTAAIQHSSFNAVGNWKFNSAMTTGNLRDAVSGLILWLLGRDERANKEQFFVLGAVCLMFALGGLVGGLITLHHPEHALAPCLLGVAMAIICSNLKAPQTEHQIDV